MAELTIKQKADAIIAKWKKKVTALLTLTTSTGDMLEFKDLEPTAMPKEGDFATINGQVPPAEVIVVDGENKTVYSFDEKGAVTKVEVKAEETEEESEEMKALREENAALKEQMTALESQIDSHKTDITAMISEFEGVARLITSGKTIVALNPGLKGDDSDKEPDSQSAEAIVNLQKLKEKKGRS